MVFVAEIRLNPSSLWLKTSGKAARPLLMIESPSMSPLGMAGAGTWQASEWGVSTSFCWGFYRRTWRLIILIIDNGMIMILPPGTAPKSKKWIPQLQKWKHVDYFGPCYCHAGSYCNIWGMGQNNQTSAYFLLPSVVRYGMWSMPRCPNHPLNPWHVVYQV